MDYLLTIIGSLIAIVGYLFVKKKSAEALLTNVEVSKELVKADAEIEKNRALLNVEEEKRKQLMEKPKDEKDDLSSLNDFFNKK